MTINKSVCDIQQLRYTNYKQNQNTLCLRISHQMTNGFQAQNAGSYNLLFNGNSANIITTLLYLNSMIQLKNLIQFQVLLSVKINFICLMLCKILVMAKHLRTLIDLKTLLIVI